jgi:hypothetical protein
MNRLPQVAQDALQMMANRSDRRWRTLRLSLALEAVRTIMRTPARGLSIRARASTTPLQQAEYMTATVLPIALAALTLAPGRGPYMTSKGSSENPRNYPKSIALFLLSPDAFRALRVLPRRLRTAELFFHCGYRAARRVLDLLQGQFDILLDRLDHSRCRRTLRSGFFILL